MHQVLFKYLGYILLKRRQILHLRFIIPVSGVTTVSEIAETFIEVSYMLEEYDKIFPI